MNLIEPTNYYFDPKFLETDFTLKFALATRYKKGFDVIEEYKECGNSRDPLNTIPAELQILPGVTILHMYTMQMEKTLEWHKDEMVLDYKSSGKYTALIEGSGRLEVKKEENSTVESYEFTEKYRYVKFMPTDIHRFIPYEKTKMVVSNTMNSDTAYFDVSLYKGINSTESNRQLEDPEEKRRFLEFLEEWYRKNT